MTDITAVSFAVPPHRRELGRIVGIGTATKWQPKVLAAKDRIVEWLIHERGLAGLELETTALAIADKFKIRPFDVAQSHNTLVNGGTNIMLTLLTGTGTAFTNAVAALGVGDSSSAFGATQTNLQGTTVTTDRIRKAMNATFPSVAAAVATFQATFATTDANFVWNEWAIFNNVTDASGTMLNRSVANLGTKTSASAWQLTVTLTQS